jgi:hypothetical protein
MIAVLLFPALAAAQDDGPSASRVIDKHEWSFVVSKGGKATGRLDVGYVVREDTRFMVGGSHTGAKAAQEAKRAKVKPPVRSYAELDPKGFLGRYKRWEPAGKGEKYWYLFQYEGKLKLRHEKGVGDKGSVKDAGAAGTQLVPLEKDQPQLAWLLTSGSRPAEVECVGAHPNVRGKATVARVGEEDTDLPGGQKARLTRWEIKGDCGEYTVMNDASGDPVVLACGGIRWDRKRK